MSIWLRTTRLCVITATALAGSACASSSPAALATPNPAPSMRASQAAAATPSPTPAPAETASPSPTPPPAETAGPSPTPFPAGTAPVQCVIYNVNSSSKLILLGRPPGDLYEYDAQDPLNPRLICKLRGTTAFVAGNRLFYLDQRSASETAFGVRILADGTSYDGASYPAYFTNGAYSPKDGGLSAYTIQVPSASALGGSEVQVYVLVWVRQWTPKLLFTYPVGIGDCICRFGLPPPVLAISWEGQYLVAGRLTGKGSQPLAIYDLSTDQIVGTLPDALDAFWDRDTDRLFAVTSAGVEVWSPSGGVSQLAGAKPWTYIPGRSPDGKQVAYTDYVDTQQLQPRVFVYDFASGTTRMLSTGTRTEAVFVQDGWVWYFEEQPCADCAGNTKPSGKVFAMDLATGIEQTVTFAAGEAPNDLEPAGFWPNS